MAVTLIHHLVCVGLALLVASIAFGWAQRVRREERTITFHYYEQGAIYVGKLIAGYGVALWHLALAALWLWAIYQEITS